MSAFWVSLVQALASILPDVWKDIKRGDETQAQRRLHEKADREINIAIAKRRLKERKKQ